MRKALVTIWMGMLMSSTAAAFDFVTLRGEGMGGAIYMSQPTATSQITLPTATVKPGQLLADAGFVRIFELSDLDRIFVAGVYRHLDWSAGLGIAQFGKSDLYAEKTVKLSVARHFSLLTGWVSVSCVHASFGGNYGSLSAVTCGGGASHQWRNLLAGFAVDNLTSPRLDRGSPVIDPTFSLYGEILGRGSYSLLGRATYESDEKPRYALAQAVRLSPRASLFWGLSTGPAKYGGGFEVSHAQTEFVYAGSYHPVLGFSHAFSMAVFLGKPHSGTQDGGEDTD